MIRRITLIILVLSVTCYAQTIASRRYAERTPYQYNFGPLLAIAPYVNAPDYTTSPVANVQPSNMIISNNTCSSTANFSVLEQTSPAATFSTASNICTVTTGSSGGVYLLGDANSSFSVPSVFISVKVNTAGAYEFGPVLSNATGSIYLISDLYNSGSCNLVLYDGGFVNLSLNTCTAPGAGGYVGLSLVGNDACMWISTNGTTWTVTGCGSTASTYNFETDGNLTGFKAGVRLTGTSTTWSFSNLISGAFGGTAVRDISLVTYSDGRPYINGSTAYLTATTVDPNAAGYDGVYTFNLTSNLLTEIGEIWNNRGGAIVGDDASHLIYDLGTQGYRYFVGGWGTGTSNTYYGAFSRSSIDPLAGGLVTVAATSELTAPSGWDTHVACTSWNYSTNTCSYWLLGQSQDFPYAYYTTSDPSANSWTQLAVQSEGYLTEGTRILRTATGQGGVNYIIAAGGASNSDARYYTTMNSSGVAGSNLTGFPAPGGYQNASHPQFFTYGNTAYLLAFDNTKSLLGNGSQSMGNFGVSTAPRYSAQTNWPTFVGGAAGFSAGSSVTTQSTSSTINVGVGDLIVGMCRGSSPSTTSSIVSSSPSNTFTMDPLNLITTGSGTGFDQGFYAFATSSGATTFTCTVSPSQTYTGITVIVYSPGFLTTTDYIGYQNQLGSSLQTYTSGTFSTTAPGLVVLCADGLFGASFSPNLIGPYIPGGSFGMTEGSAACAATTTTGAQSSITASMGSRSSSGTGAQWGGIIMSFK